MAIFDDPNWLQGAYPGIAAMLQQQQAPDIQGGGPVQIPGPPAYSPGPAQAPVLRQKRTVGNVLHDLLTDHTDAHGVPVSEKIARLGDAFTNAAHNWRGQPTVDMAGQMRDAREHQAAWEKTQEDLRNAQMAKHVFANLLGPDAQPVDLQQLAQLDPDAAMAFEQDQRAQATAAAASARQSQQDKFNYGKPVPLGGNGGFMIYSPEDPAANANGWVVHEGTPPMQKFVTGDDQAGLVDTRTGTFKPIGGKKIPARKTAIVEIQGPDGTPIKQLVDSTTGQPIHTIGASAPKGKAADKQGDPSGALKILDDIDKGFDDLYKMKGLTGQGNPLSILGRTETGSRIAAKFNDPAAQKRLELNKNISSLQSEMIKSLPASATRTKFEQEIQKTRLPDPLSMNYSTAKTVIKQLRENYKAALKEIGTSAPAAATGGNAAALAEARRRGLIK